MFGRAPCGRRKRLLKKLASTQVLIQLVPVLFPAVGMLSDFLGSSVSMGLRVGLVGELSGNECFLQSGGQLLGEADGAFYALVGWGEFQLGPIGPDDIDALNPCKYFI